MRSRINVSDLRLEHVVLRAIMDISARAISLADRPRTGHSGHQCSHAPGKTDPPSRLILSQTSAGKGCWLRHRSLLTSRRYWAADLHSAFAPQNLTTFPIFQF